MSAYPNVFRIKDCQHRPPCPQGTTRWVCGKRTEIEAAVAQHIITREAGASLLMKMGTTMSGPSKVYTGAVVERQRRLL